MKKIFTLLAVVFMAVNVSADTVELDITGTFTYNWGETESFVVNDDGSITYNSAAWGGMCSWMGGQDLTSYGKLVFEFAEPTTCNTQILVESLIEGNTGTAWGNVGITKLEYTITEKDNSVKQVALQTSEAVTLVIKGVYLMSVDETESTVLWEGECAFGNWENGFSIEAAKFADFVEGDAIEFVYTTDKSTDEPWYQFKTVFADTQTTLSSNASELNEYGCASVGASSTNYKIVLNAADIEMLKETGLYTNGHNVIVTKVNKVMVVTGVDTVKAVQHDGVRYNLSGQKVDASYKGIVIENGRKVVIK